MADYSNVDPATLFTDYNITQYVTIVMGRHVTELRTAMDMRRSIALLAPQVWTPAITPHVTVISRADIQQLRDSLDLAIGHGTYTDDRLTDSPPGVVLVKKQHIQELRDRVQ